MKSIQILLIIAFTSLVCALSAGAQTGQVDFSGTWELDSKASDSMEAIFNLQKISWIKKKLGANLDAETVIKQTEDSLTLAFDNIAGKTIQQLFFDGKEHLTKNPAGHEAWLTTTWSKDGKVLTTTGPATTHDGYKGVMTEVRMLSKDGTTMFLTVSVKLSDGRTASVRRVFRKKILNAIFVSLINIYSGVNPTLFIWSSI